MLSASVAALHFLFAFALVALLAAEWVLVARKPDLVSVRTLVLVDALYGMVAVSLLVAGLVRAIYLEKGWAYYAHSGPFIAKLTVFAVIAVLSIYPTVSFFRNAGEGKTLSAQKASNILRVIGLELVLVVVLIVCASLAAKGIWTIR